MKFHSLRTATLAAALSVLAACGGGGDGSSTASVAPTTTTPAAAATTTVVTTGAITAFGSVFVNGIHFQTSGASFERDKSPTTQQALRVGQVVTVKGTVNADGTTGTAQLVSHDNDLEGPISSIDATTQTFVLLAHTVKVTADTSFDDSLSPTSFAALTVGLQVEVSGSPDSTGAIVATRIEKRAAGVTGLEILGKVANLDTTARKFNIDSLVVDYSAAQLLDFSGSIKAGDLVEVKGSSRNTAGDLLATRVELRNVESGIGSGRREIEGLVTRFTSATDFDVAGRKVATTSSTVYENGTVADLKLDARLEVKGSIDAAGVLVATKVEFRRGGSAGLAGRIEAVTPATTGTGGTIKVLGVTITINANSRIEDKSPAKIELFRINDLNAGDYVRVRGTETAALQLTATRLERRTTPSSGESYVRGTVRDVARPALTILGVPVDTTASTVFKVSTPAGTTAADRFFATAAGGVYSARGSVTNGRIAAREIQAEDIED